MVATPGPWPTGSDDSLAPSGARPPQPAHSRHVPRRTGSGGCRLAAGWGSRRLAQQEGISRTTVRRWVARFLVNRCTGLKDRPRRGRPTCIRPVTRALTVALACERPAERNVPLSRYSLAEIAAEVGVLSDDGQRPSRSSIWRLLRHDALRPWRYWCWIFPRDPHFLERAGPVLDLYACVWQGQPLWADEYVLSADEKTSIQVRRRRHPTLPTRPFQTTRVEHEYARGGALQYLAAWDVHRAEVFGRCEPHTGKAAFGRLVDQVMRQEPYRSARRVFWMSPLFVALCAHDGSVFGSTFWALPSPLLCLMKTHLPNE